MAPSRTRDRTQNAEASSSKPKAKPHYQRHAQEPDLNAVPGVQKVKAALRQTRRLLAKDNLAANVRVETERRQRALEAELNQAELAKKERAFAMRYHKIKFFERQKVTRKLKQANKGLQSAEDESKKKKHSSNIQELRIDLNYILHYPKTKKYISLFPPEIRRGEEPSAASLAETAKTNADREEVRKWIREQMKEGDLPAEPEVELLTQHGNSKQRSQKWPQGEATTVTKSDTKQIEDTQEDDFFGDDDESS